MPGFGDFSKNGFKTVFEKNFRIFFSLGREILRNSKLVENFFLESAKLFRENFEFFFQKRF
jgi:hypothetical protein